MCNRNWAVTNNYDDLSAGTPIYTCAVNMGAGISARTAYGTGYAYLEGSVVNDGTIRKNDESLNGRMVPTYAGITTVIFAPAINATTTSIIVFGLVNLDINTGDFLTIDDEIVRVKTTVADDDTSISVFRGVMGNKATTHSLNSTIRSLDISPIELRRHAIIRASGHTFEYVGFGPGNYYTAFPEKQDREITPKEELLAQSTKREGGVNFYTGMNDKGVS
jgi:hypothetical protein